MRKVNWYYPLIIIVYIIMAILLGIYQPEFANSGLFSASVTVFVGSFVIWVYTRSKVDDKNSAATILFLEIKESESELKKLIDYKIANEGSSYPQENIVRLLQNKAWAKYSHLFVEDFNSDEYQQLNEYFKKCEILEKFFEKQHNFFWISTEERAKQKETIGSKLAYDNPSIESSDFKKQVETISGMYISNTSIYAPAGITTQINKLLESITLLSITPIWEKLKEMAKYTK